MMKEWKTEDRESHAEQDEKKDRRKDSHRAQGTGGNRTEGGGVVDTSIEQGQGQAAVEKGEKRTEEGEAKTETEEKEYG